MLGLERFELGHSRGASHDSSRILRHSYHTPAYVRLTQQAYDDWARLSAAVGEELVTVVGGLDLFPPGAAIPIDDYTSSLDDVGIGYELLDTAGDRVALAAVLAAVGDGRAVPGPERDRACRTWHQGDAGARAVLRRGPA